MGLQFNVFLSHTHPMVRNVPINICLPVIDRFYMFFANFHIFKIQFLSPFFAKSVVKCFLLPLTSLLRRTYHVRHRITQVGWLDRGLQYFFTQVQVPSKTDEKRPRYRRFKVSAQNRCESGYMHQKMRKYHEIPRLLMQILIFMNP